MAVQALDRPHDQYDRRSDRIKAVSNGLLQIRRETSRSALLLQFIVDTNGAYQRTYRP